MDTFKKRLPKKKELFPLFAICALPIHILAIFGVLIEIPAMILRFGIWDIVASASYTLTFALAESFLFFFVVLFLIIVSPPKFLTSNIATKGPLISLLVIYSSALFSIHEWKSFFIWLAGFLIIVGILYRITPLLSRILQNLTERLVVLSVFYLLLDFFSLIVVIIRNIL